MAHEEKPIKKFYVHSEMVAAGEWADFRKNEILDEIHLSNSYATGGCDWEFGIELHKFSDGHVAMRIDMFDDAFKAFKEAPELVEMLPRYNQKSGDKDSTGAFRKLIEELEKAGWKHHKPNPKRPAKLKHCPACGRT